MQDCRWGLLLSGLAHGLPVMTTDRVWAKLDMGLKILETCGHNLRDPAGDSRTG
jgi:hypothetical protein